MIDNLFKILKSDGRYNCRNYYCKNLPQYISKRGTIKRGSVMLFVGPSAFCFDCIDEVLETAKLKLNKSFWIFK